MGEQHFDSFEALINAVLAEVRQYGAANCVVEPSDDILSRRFGYQVVRGDEVSVYRIPLTRLKSDVWARRVADSETRQHITRALSEGLQPL